jgi:hypothetical protein
MLRSTRASPSTDVHAGVRADCGREVFVWFGKKSTPAQRKFALSLTEARPCPSAPLLYIRWLVG